MPSKTVADHHFVLRSVGRNFAGDQHAWVASCGCSLPLTAAEAEQYDVTPFTAALTQPFRAHGAASLT